ncbi:CLK4-associating serine/arginine rich protein-like isoform X1 [Daphnia pulicaria]|nr:CLK4-associating serine/arginine rich protein-like isoform X1 [Daphnia pulicaria]
MWHEARKQERLLKSMMVDHRRRAERRREYYEKTKGDPAQFLQVHGRPMKIHVDPAIAAIADSPATMMPWQGQPEILIDRFDVRAHLDVIPCRPQKDDSDTDQDPGEEVWEERQASYERYRILVQNEFIGVSEEKFLHQILLEEQFGPVQKLGEEEKKKMLAPKKAAIGFTYDDSTPSSSAAASTSHNIPVVPPEATEEEESDSDIDLDLSIAVDKLTTEQMHEVNKCALHYGLGRQDFMSLLTRDLDEQESLRIAKEEEQERAMYSGRKARKERRAFREQKLQALLMNRCLSPPSYATRASPTYDGQLRRSKSVSKSRSPSPFEGGIKFITSFGDEDSDPGGKTISSRSPNKTRDKDLPNKRPFASTTFLARDRGGRPLNSGRDTTKVNDKRHSRSGDHRARSPSPSISRSRKDKKSGSYYKNERSRSRSRRRSRSRHRSSRSRSRSRRRSRHSRSRSRSYSPRSSRRQRNRSPPRERSRRKSSSSSSSSSSSRSSSSRQSIRRSSSPIRPPPSYASLARETRHFSPPQISNPLPAPPVRRYYGRKKSDSDSSLSDRESTSPSKPTVSNSASKPSTPSVTGSSGRGTGATKNTMTPQERLKRKMQAALNKQYKADKRAEKEKLQKVEQERMNREEEMRELALRLRRKERMRRHAAQGESGSSSPSSRSPSRSPSRTPS